MKKQQMIFSEEEEIEAAQAWFLRLQAEPDNLDLLSDFEAWKDGAPKRESYYLDVLLTWEDLGQLPSLQNKAVSCVPFVERTEPCAEGVSTTKGWGSTISRFAFAAGLCGVFIIALFNMYAVPPTDYVAATGERVVVELEDGSVLRLNAESAISMSFSEQERRLELLYGEAYFEVAADNDRPFVVDASQLSTRALGTEFNVRFIKDEQVETTLVEGKVEVSIPTGIAKQMLAGQTAQWGAEQEFQIEIRSIQKHPQAPAWTKNLLRVDEVPLFEVVEQLNRHYVQVITITETDLVDTPISGTLPLDDLDTVLTLLSSTLSIQNSQLGFGKEHRIILLHK